MVIQQSYGRRERHEQYDAEMLRYYDNPSNDARHTSARKWARHYREEFNTPGNWLREAALAVQEAVRGRRVLELACGHCRWTPFIAEVAEHVLATDLSPNMLAWGRKVMKHSSPDAANVEFLLADAYRPDEIPGEFDAATVMNWIQHIPRARHDDFLHLLHAKLGPGGLVFLGANHLSERARTGVYRKAGEADWYMARARPDGSKYEIIDNVFDEAKLRLIFEPHAQNVCYVSGKSWWWVVYRVR